MVKTPSGNALVNRSEEWRISNESCITTRTNGCCLVSINLVVPVGNTKSISFVRGSLGNPSGAVIKVNQRTDPQLNKGRPGVLVGVAGMPGFDPLELWLSPLILPIKEERSMTPCVKGGVATLCIGDKCPVTPCIRDGPAPRHTSLCEQTVLTSLQTTTVTWNLPWML